MTTNGRGDDIVELFRALPPAERAGVLDRLFGVGVPDDYGGVFVDPNKEPADRRAEVLYELDGLVNAQSIGFTAEMLPLLYPFLNQLRGRPGFLEAIDVGARTGAGTALLSDIFMTYHSGLPTVFDTLDIDPTFQSYQRSRWPRLRQTLVGDLFELPASAYDFVICSHTVEHIRDPIPFCRQLQRVARDFAFIFCPYEEQDPIPGHYTVSDAMIRSLDPIYVQTVKSWWWQPDQGTENVVFFVLPGNNRQAAAQRGKDADAI